MPEAPEHHTGDGAKPRLSVTVFSDYICPFCYVGDARLDKLRDGYELDVEWCFYEIHPDNPAEGKPVEELYPRNYEKGKASRQGQNGGHDRRISAGARLTRYRPSPRRRCRRPMSGID